MSGLHISGVLVHARAESLNSVRTQLESVPGVEVHAVTPEGRLVTVVEKSNDGELADTFLDMQNTAGVLSASLVYHYSDNDVAGEMEPLS